jgi:hypothetical protein
MDQGMDDNVLYTLDAVNNARTKYENCKQRQHGQFESYFFCHREAIDNLADDSKASWNVVKVMQGSLQRYFGRWREYPDLLDPEETTSEDSTRMLTADREDSSQSQWQRPTR